MYINFFYLAIKLCDFDFLNLFECRDITGDGADPPPPPPPPYHWWTDPVIWMVLIILLVAILFVAFVLYKDNKKNLFLIVSEDKYPEISSLNKAEKISLDDANKLFSLINFLSIQKRTELKLNDLKEFQVSPNNQTNGDVYLIQVELNEINLGFNKDATLIERKLAFQSLSEQELKITISPRYKKDVLTKISNYK